MKRKEISISILIQKAIAFIFPSLSSSPLLPLKLSKCSKKAPKNSTISSKSKSQSLNTQKVAIFSFQNPEKATHYVETPTEIILQNPSRSHLYHFQSLAQAQRPDPLLLSLRNPTMIEIFPADPYQPSSSSFPPPPPPPPWAQRADETIPAVPEPFDSEKIPQTLVSKVRPFLRVANQIEAESPRSAYLCRVHAFQRAHVMDPRSTGRGVRQFKTSLLKRLEKDHEATVIRRKEKSDVRELKSFYHEKLLVEAHEITSVLSEVLKVLESGAGPEILASGDHIEARSVFNILPLHSGGSQQAIMLFPEINAAVSAVCNVRGLPSPENNQEARTYADLLDWLQCWFGFQKANVSNQREHLILLLSNIQVRQKPKPVSMSKLDDRTVNELMMKVFKNYMNWCNFLGRKRNLLLPHIKQEVQQYKILYIALYLLIWGEASNLRLMPECLCYIFHHMAYELYSVLTTAVSLNTGKKVLPAYGGGSESFLENVVTPIYRVVFEEAQKNKYGTADHSTWRNYDDLNEFFWSLDCFKLGWPMRLQHDFFCTSSPTDQNTNSQPQATTSEDNPRKWLGKTHFVEIRSFWHIFRSFDRMWTFLLLALQMLIIMAWHDLETPLQIFDRLVFEDILTIFITNAVLRLIQVTLDIAFTWKARHTMNYYQKLRFLLKFFIAAMWTMTLPTTYVSSQTNSSCSSHESESNLNKFCLSPYMVVVAIYLMTNAIGMILFLVPAASGFIETSNWQACSILSWWAQPRLFIGRGMQECLTSLLKYTIFWLILLSSKFLFSYHFEIKPLVEPTKKIMKVSVDNYDWHELFPEVKSNAGAIFALWTPVILVYFMDTQIWYSIFCTIFGGAYGIIHHLGEVRTMGMVRSRFHLLPSAFHGSLVPPSPKKQKERSLKSFLFNKIFKNSEVGVKGFAKFALVWNKIIRSFRTEDLISNREMDLMLFPISSEFGCGKAQWPLFLLATKFSTAIDMARDFEGKYEHLYRKIKKDHYMFHAVQEFYNSMKIIFSVLVSGELEKRAINAIFNEIETSIGNASLLVDIKMNELPSLHDKFIRLVEILFENKQIYRDRLIILLQDIFEIVMKDMMIHSRRILEMLNCSNDDLFRSSSVINLPLPDEGPLKQQVKRLFLLLTVKDKAMDIPTNLEARRRISFFATSLFMDIPVAPKVREMLSFSVMTPYYTEEVKFSEEELHSTEDGASILSYMQKIYPDEWKNFLERFDFNATDENSNITNDEIRYWASFRGQTLSRTVRGMMNYRKALKLQAFLDLENSQDILKGHAAFERDYHNKNSQQALSAQLDALVDMKFTYVISCQNFGAQKSSGDSHAQDIIDLMIRYPSLRVAYIEEKELIVANKPHKVYSSVLVKADKNLDEEVYRIKLPGLPVIGEGKPENQNHAIIFTRGDALQTIDMNQDNYLEEAFKMRNLLQEFLGYYGEYHPTILGLREHIFTGSVSSLAGFMSYQETSFVTIGQRFLANPLRVRFHYGHPDVFDRVFHLTRGGISKASKTVNLSEDVFAGFNSTLRQGCVTYSEYMQVGKGRDVGLNEISKFEAKVTNGNSEQAISRDIYRLGRRFDFFRMLSCYYTTVGFYFNSLISVLCVYVFLYGQLYLVLSGLEKALLDEAKILKIKSLETALSSQSFLQLGLLTGLPMIMEVGLEKGFRTALSDFILMQLQLASVFFTFSLGTKAHYFGRTILHGGAKYRPTGRKFVVFHASFTENYQLYSRSHFVRGFELLFLLIVYNLFRGSYESSVAYAMTTYSVWFMALTWLVAPFLFNPSGFAWGRIVEDWRDWTKWMNYQGGIGVQPEKSWESWWNTEYAHLRHSNLGSRILEIILSLRFFIYQYGLVYHLAISQENKNIVVYVLSWSVIIAIFLLVKAVDEGKRWLSVNYHLAFRFFKFFLFIGVLSAIIALVQIYRLTMTDLIVCCLAFLPTGWGLLAVAQAFRPKIEDYKLWDCVRVIAQAYDYGMGSLIFAPIAVLAWMPVISAIQTRVLFNPAFSRQLQIQPILPGKSKKR